jgi:hypothetical protein
MSFNTYSDLQAAVGSWLGGRSDLNSFIPDFITLFEANANRRLRVRQMETQTTLTPSSGVATLPTDFLIWRRVTWAGSVRRELEYVHPSWIALSYSSVVSGTPNVFTTQNGSLVVAPASDSPVEFDYYQKIPPLADAVNWLYTNWPDVYLFGSLAESGDFTKDDNLLAKWVARRDAIYQEIETLDKRAQGVGGIRVVGPTP